ncbi:MAG: TaqI-like C-terminal specificity domain-containing protein, partial [Candidatus Taylorbacteria bacterium]
MMKFNEKYNRENFSEFLISFLPEDYREGEKDITQLKSCQIITSAKELGYCKSLDAYVLEMNHSKSTDPRITIATDAFKVLRNYDIQRALVIFKNNESDNYRFSYLTITFDINEKSKITKTYSNARRYSFYLGVDAKIKTPEQQLLKKGKIKDVDDLLSRFSVEVVNKQFYLEVAKHFDELVSGDGKNLMLPGVSHENINIRKSFAVRLIGRLMFCWFLKQKKSSSGQLIPDGLLSSKIVSGNYYHSTLEPLFFGALNTSKESRDISSDLFDQVPYLNGGLFSPQSDDYYELDRGTFASLYINTLKISDQWFKDFFELLETYNFTIDENTVFDQELSVDPEMLGRIFENLLAEINPETGSSERKRTGSFYTPRQIVEYMVDQSLLEYLKTKTKIDEKKLSALISYDLTDDLDYPLYESEKQEVINAIESLKILDPACGSGAYPIGALQKIVYILQQIDPDCKLWLERKLRGVPELYKQKIINEVKSNPFNYTRKLDVIKNSIFGVDIQPIAVDVSRLRCFLTLVVESEVDDSKSNRGIEPLPNLDFKFVCANTLIGLPKNESGQVSAFEDHSGILELSKIMSEYFSCNSQRKNEIKLKFTNLQKEIFGKSVSAFGKNTGELTLKLTTWNPFSNTSNSWFDPKWMFGLEEKFDVVIGNPPYVNLVRIPKEERDNYKKLFTVTKNKVDLYAFFIEKSQDLINENGILSYIIPQTWKATNSFFKLRQFIVSRFTIKQILNLEIGIFIAIVRPLVILLKKGKEKNYKIKVYDSKFTQTSEVNIDEILSKKDLAIDTESSRSDKILFNKIESLSKPLGEIIQFTRGIKTSDDKRFIGKNLINDEYKKIYRGKNIKAYELNWQGEYVWYRPDLMREKEGCLPHTKELFEVPVKLVTQRINSSMQLLVAVDYESNYFLDTTNVSRYETLNGKYSILFLLGVLNSKLINFWYSRNYRMPTIGLYELHSIPIKETELIQEKVSKLVEVILQAKKTGLGSDVKDNQLKIDELVMDLYGLNEEEKEII